MLVVLLLVVLAAGVLAAGVVLHEPELAWWSLVLTAFGGLLLLLLERRRRRTRGGQRTGDQQRTGDPKRSSGRHRMRRSAADTGSQPKVPSGESADGGGPRSSGPVGSIGASTGAAPAVDRGGTARTSGLLAGSAGPEGRAAPSTASDPGVERVTVGVRSRAQLSARVLVVDERPRYHLQDCPWLAEQTGPQPMGLTVEKAQELGFTPCARCGPDEHIARHRGGG